MLSTATVLFLAARAGTTPLGEAKAATCNGEAPRWCAKWTEPDEPFFNCTGSSMLEDGECGAWQELYDRNGGTAWSDCADARADPCACHGKTHGKHGKGAIVYCKAGHIESIDMMGNRLSGNLTDALSRMPGLLLLNLGVNQLEGPVPAFPSTLVELYIGGNKNPAGKHGFQGEIPDLSVRPPFFLRPPCTWCTVYPNHLVLCGPGIIIQEGSLRRYAELAALMRSLRRYAGD
jgi:hypothetical protein